MMFLIPHRIEVITHSTDMYADKNLKSVEATYSEQWTGKSFWLV